MRVELAGNGHAPLRDRLEMGPRYVTTHLLNDLTSEAIGRPLRANERISFAMAATARAAQGDPALQDPRKLLAVREYLGQIRKDSPRDYDTILARAAAWKQQGFSAILGAGFGNTYDRPDLLASIDRVLAQTIPVSLGPTGLKPRAAATNRPVRLPKPATCRADYSQLQTPYFGWRAETDLPAR
jgi:hypothetical protein